MKNKLIVVLSILILLLLAKLNIAENDYQTLEDSHIELIEVLNDKETKLNKVNKELRDLKIEFENYKSQ